VLTLPLDVVLSPPVSKSLPFPLGFASVVLIEAFVLLRTGWSPTSRHALGVATLVNSASAVLGVLSWTLLDVVGARFIAADPAIGFVLVGMLAVVISEALMMIPLAGGQVQRTVQVATLMNITSYALGAVVWRMLG
jgi:hypothetical protein